MFYVKNYRNAAFAKRAERKNFRPIYNKRFSLLGFVLHIGRAEIGRARNRQFTIYRPLYRQNDDNDATLTSGSNKGTHPIKGKVYFQVLFLFLSIKRDFWFFFFRGRYSNYSIGAARRVDLHMHDVHE